MTSQFDSSLHSPSIVQINGCKERNLPWFRSIFNFVKNCSIKSGVFNNDTIKEQRIMDYTVAPNYKFVFAKYNDGIYRPAKIIGRSKKMQLFVVCFYHNEKCLYLKPNEILLRHGNLLEKRVCFKYAGQKRVGKVFGNNSPANHGFPSTFYIKKRDTWYKVSFKSIFLTKRQVSKMYFTRIPIKRKNSQDSSICSKSNMDVDTC